ARKRGTKAEVWAESELKVPVGRAADVEVGWFRELSLVSAGRADGKPEGFARSDLSSVEREIVAGRDAAHLHRSVVAKDLLHRGRNEAGLISETCELVAVLEQREDTVTDRKRRSLVSVHEQEDGIGQELLPGQSSALRLGLDQAAQQCVVRMRLQFGHERGEVVSQRVCTVKGAVTPLGSVTDTGGEAHNVG